MESAKEPLSSRQLIVKGLLSKVTAETLQTYFEQFGVVLEAIICADTK